jgi:hypothetical protein
MARTTLHDIAVQRGVDAVVGLIDEAAKAHPEITAVSARTIKGTNYKTLVRTALGNTSGSFRDANEGVTAHKHTYVNRLVETFILNPRWECDKALADAHEDGAEAFIRLEAEGTMEGEFQALSKQFYYGHDNGGHAKGHPGLIDMYDATNMVVDAGGTTATTGSSVWFVCFGEKDVQWVWGQNGQLQPSDIRIETIYDANDNPLDGYVQTMTAWAGLQVASLRSIVRIKKLTADSGKGLTDDLIASALLKFPTGKVPDACFMSRRSLGQLQSSRTATNPTGQPAPFPTTIIGLGDKNIPILVTDGILDTEALTL